MTIVTTGISSTIYRKSSRGLTNPVDLDFETQQVYSAIDGISPISMVANQSGVSIPVMWKAIAKLTRLKLIEIHTENGNSMGREFADKLHKELTKAVGPMSDMVIKNVTQISNISWPDIPPARAKEFIYRLVVQIPNDRLKNQFQKTMFKEL